MQKHSNQIRALLPWVYAVCVIAAIEVLYLTLVKPDRHDRTNFLTLSYDQPERIQRSFAHDKIKAFRDSDPDILLVGDSSGHHGVIPQVALTELPAGFKMVNLGIATNVGYEGYLHLAELMLRNNPSIQYVILYNSPAGGIPREALWRNEALLKGSEFPLMSKDIYNEYVSPFRKLFQIPTLAARRDVMTFLTPTKRVRGVYDQPLARSSGYLMFERTNEPGFGWSREVDQPGDFPSNIYEMLENSTEQVSVETFFDWKEMRDKSYMEEIYEEFCNLVLSYGAKPVIVFHPVPSGIEDGRDGMFEFDQIDAEFKRAAALNPEATFEGLEFWPDEKFSVFSHVSTLYSEESSLRVGKILRSLIDRDGANPKDRPKDFLYKDIPKKVVIDCGKPFCGFGFEQGLWRDRRKGHRFLGPRNLAYAYTFVRPTTAYQMDIEFHTELTEEMSERMKFRVNDVPLTAKSAGPDPPGVLSLTIPEEVAAQWQGWTKVEFDFRGIAEETADDSSENDKIALSRLTFSPLPN